MTATATATTTTPLKSSKLRISIAWKILSWFQLKKERSSAFNAWIPPCSSNVFKVFVQSNRKFWIFFAQFALTFLISHEIVKAIYTFFCRTARKRANKEKEWKKNGKYRSILSRLFNVLICLLTWLQCSNFIPSPYVRCKVLC